MPNMMTPTIQFTLTRGPRKRSRNGKKRHISIMPSIFLMTTSLEDQMLQASDAVEVTERIRAMRKQETTHHRCVDYMKESDTLSLLSTSADSVDEESRVKMTEWCYQVVDFCKFRRETVGIGMKYLDRYLATLDGRAALMNLKFYQLAAMTSLYMAIKIHEPLEMETSLLADLSRGCYTDKQIAEMEMEILQALEWRLAGPTPLCFVQHFVALFPDSVDIRIKAAIMDYSRYQTELAVSSVDLVSRHPSEIALAAILNAMEGIDRKLLPLRKQGAFIRHAERACGLFVEALAEIQDCLSAILLDIYPENPASETSSSIHWELLSSYDTDDGETTPKSVGRSTISSYVDNSTISSGADTSPVWVGFR